MAHALAHLQQATTVAAQYQLSTWPLSMHFIEAILILPMSLGGAEDVLEASHRFPFSWCMPFYRLWTQMPAGLKVSIHTLTICPSLCGRDKSL